MFNFVLATLATFGLAALIANYDGPWGTIVRFRDEWGIPECTVCVAVWVAVVVVALANLGLLSYFAIIGVVILLERLT